MSTNPVTHPRSSQKLVQPGRLPISRERIEVSPNRVEESIKLGSIEHRRMDLIGTTSASLIIEASTVPLLHRQLHPINVNLFVLRTPFPFPIPLHWNFLRNKPIHAWIRIFFNLQIGQSLGTVQYLSCHLLIRIERRSMLW